MSASSPIGPGTAQGVALVGLRQALQQPAEAMAALTQSMLHTEQVRQTASAAIQLKLSTFELVA